MVEMILSWYCPNDCDRKTAKKDLVFGSINSLYDASCSDEFIMNFIVHTHHIVNDSQHYFIGTYKGLSISIHLKYEGKH
mgnify:CR=1 FL=1|jgi:hypothetical protein